MYFEPDSISESKLHELRGAAEHAWSDETRPEDSRGHPQPSAGQCYVTSQWLANKIQGYVGVKNGHFFTVTPDKEYVIDLTGEWNARGDHPGPIVYTQAKNPLYKDFRIPNLPEHSRAALFAKRANAALEGKLFKHADSGGSGSDAYPGEGPQAEEEFNLRDFHDPVIDDLNLSMEEPVEKEFQFVYAGGQLKVSPTEDHQTLLQQTGTLPDQSGPVAIGYVNLRGRDALWSVETNIGMRGLVKVLKDYTKQNRWTWGGLADSTGNPVHDDFGAKKSYWYGWRNGKLKLSAQPFWGHFDEIEVVGKIAHFNRSPNPFALDGLEEWAEDFGYRLADYPGGTDMNDRIKNKEWPTTYDKGDPEADPGKAFDGEPQGNLTCPYCDETLPDFKAYVMHTQGHQDSEMQPIDDGHFPTIRPLDEPLGFGTQSQPTAIPVMGSIQESNSWNFQNEHDMQLEGKNPDNFRGVPGQPYNEEVGGFGKGMRDQYGRESEWHIGQDWGPEHMDMEKAGCEPMQTWLTWPNGDREMGFDANDDVDGGDMDHWSFVAAGGQEGKDLLQAPIPFIYDVERDFVTVGHPGMHTHDVMPVGGEEPVTISVAGLPPQGQEGQEVELGGEMYVWHNY